MAITGGNLWIELPKFNQTVIAHKNLFHQSGASSFLMSSNNSIKRNVTLRAGTGNETGTGNEQLQYTTVNKPLSFNDGQKICHTQVMHMLMLCYAYAIAITIDSFPFLISWTHSFSSAFYFIAFSLSFRLHFCQC